MCMCIQMCTHVTCVISHMLMVHELKTHRKLTHVCSKSACAYRGKHIHGTYM